MMNKEEKYKKAINELADSYELHLKQWAKRCIDTINEYTTNLQQENKKQKEVIDKAKSLNHEISHIIYEDFLEENIIGSKFLYERIKKQLSILEDKEVSE